MDARDAVDTDVEAFTAAVDAPIRAMRRLVHGRTVHLAIAEASLNPHADVPADDEPVLGFVGPDVHDGVLYITRLGGTEAVVWQLLEESLRSASAEDLLVEVLVLESKTPLCEAVKHVGLSRVDHGPRFERSPTPRYVLDETG